MVSDAVELLHELGCMIGVVGYKESVQNLGIQFEQAKAYRCYPVMSNFHQSFVFNLPFPFIVIL